MNPGSHFLRQVNPAWVSGGRVTSQAFAPTPKDNNLLSGYDGAMIGPREAWVHFTQQQKLLSHGVLGVTESECVEIHLAVQPDPAPFPEHVVINFGSLGSSEIKRRAKLLRNKADARGWLFQALSTNA